MSNMVVRTNVLAINSHRSLKTVGAAQSKASSRLSSGYRVNSAADDASGLAISEKMRAQIRGLDQASINAQDAQSLIQTAEGGMQEIDNMVQRIRELVVKASNDTLHQVTAISADNPTMGDRQKIFDEVKQLVAEIDAMSERVEFNKKKLINGSIMTGHASLYFQIGANTSQGMRLNIGTLRATIKGVTAFGSGYSAKVDVDISQTLGFSALLVTGTSGLLVASGADIEYLIGTVENALTMVTRERSKLGAAQNRLEYTMKSLDVSSENLSASESRIRDTDMAKEMMNLTQANVLQQAATSMLAQANQAPQSVLQLLQ